MAIELKAKNRTVSFDGFDQPSLLHAGLAAGFDLPYECATGTCGSCRARLVDGEVEHLWKEAPGFGDGLGEDTVLLCQAQVRGDCRLAVESHLYRCDRGVPGPSLRSGTVVARNLVARETIQVVVGLDGPVAFKPGQFFNLGMKGLSGRRAYSAVNYAAGEVEALEFIVRRKPDGAMSSRLFDTDIVGVPVDLAGPYGRANFHPSERKNLLCVAGGSGLAGMLSILDAAADEGYFAQFSGAVFFGVRRLEDAFMLDRLNAFVERCGPKLSVTVALSEEEPPSSVSGRYPLLSWATGFVHEAVAASGSAKLRNTLAFLAGPPPAVEATLRLLLTAGVPAQSIRYDKFS